jgi:light-regulated signal transduction histidine kinase (bacteriophytochrome)
MGRHFPASDIPVQARRLYPIDPIRIVGDVSHAPVPLLPPSGANAEPIDMSFAHLRAVSPVHRDYLRTIGVVASLSIAIVVDGEYWGLIACHHDSGKTVPPAMRIGAELFGRYFSLQIALAERRAELLAATEARERLARIVAQGTER